MLSSSGQNCSCNRVLSLHGTLHLQLTPVQLEWYEEGDEITCFRCRQCKRPINDARETIVGWIRISILFREDSKLRCLQRFCGKVAMLEKEIEKKKKDHKINVSLRWIWISICIFRFGTFLKDVWSIRYNRLIGITSIFKELEIAV